MDFIFPQAERADTQLPIIPVFMPFAGCGVRCVFCAQTAQTGKNERQLPVVLDELETTLKEYDVAGRGPVEVAFYGGTFTALPVEEQALCLEVTKRWQRKGFVRRVRCSTRPDCIATDNVRFLQDSGVSLVELGVQSFSDRALRVSKRNYTGECVENACHLIKEQGLELGIQLMPGLPNMPSLPHVPGLSNALGLANLTETSLADSYADIPRAIAQKPSCVRLYPCLVFKETPLAAMWKAGEYSPLSLDQTVHLLSYACLAFWRENIPVIRMGVAPEASAMEKLLAGPFHYSLGNMVRGEALYQWVARHVAVFRGEKSAMWAESSSGDLFGDLSGPTSCLTPHPASHSSEYFPRHFPGHFPEHPTSLPLALDVPRAYQGDFWGFKGQLKERYAALGVAKVEFGDFCALRLSQL